MSPLRQDQLAARVREAIEAAGLKHAEVANRAGLDPSALSKALNGQRHFKTLEIALISEILEISVDRLLSGNGSSQPSVAVAARAQPDQTPAIADATDLVNELLELDDLLGKLGYPAESRFEPVTPDSRVSHLQGAQLADLLRSQTQLNDGDLPHDLDLFAAYVERTLGIDVYFCPLPAGLDGLSVARDNFKLALISSSIAATRQRFTLAHEIGHLYAGDTENLLIDEDVFKIKTFPEIRANAFAAAYLIPESKLKQRFEDKVLTEDLISELLGIYRVSVDALAFRLHNVEIIDAHTRDQIRSMSSRQIALRSGRVSDLQARNESKVPGNLLKRALDAYSDGQLSIRPIAKLLNMEPDQLIEEMSPSLTPGRPSPYPGDDAVPVL